MPEVSKKNPRKEAEPSQENIDKIESVVTKEVGKGAFAKIQRELSDKDLKNPAVGRLLLAERDRLLGEKAVLETFRDDYHQADKRAAVFEEKSKVGEKFQNLYTLCMTIGGVVLGLAFSVTPLGWLVGAIGVVLLVGGILFSKKQ